MPYKDWVEKLVVDNAIMGGEPVFGDTRVTVKRIASLAKSGETYTTIFNDYPFLTTEDIRHAVIYQNQL